MAITGTSLGHLLTTQADYNYYVQQQMYWQDKYEANSAKLSDQVKLETKWEKAYDDAYDNEKDDDKVMKAGKFSCTAGRLRGNEALSDAYAHAKVEAYDEEKSLELADLDIEYDTMKTMYDTLLQELQAEKESEKQLVSTCAQDTGLLGQ